MKLLQSFMLIILLSSAIFAGKATVTLSGRITNLNGSVPNVPVAVEILDGQTSEIRRQYANPFGYYRFEVDVNRGYMMWPVFPKGAENLYFAPERLIVFVGKNDIVNADFRYSEEWPCSVMLEPCTGWRLFK